MPRTRSKIRRKEDGSPERKMTSVCGWYDGFFSIQSTPPAIIEPPSHCPGRDGRKLQEKCSPARREKPESAECGKQQRLEFIKLFAARVPSILEKGVFSAGR